MQPVKYRPNRGRCAELTAKPPAIASYYQAIVLHDWTNLALRKTLN